MLRTIPYTAERRYAATPILSKIIQSIEAIEGLKNAEQNYLDGALRDDVLQEIEAYRLKVVQLNLRILEMTDFQIEEEMKD